MDSVDKIIEYVVRVSKEPVTVNGVVRLENPIELVTLSPNFFVADGCEMCGRCCININTAYTPTHYSTVINTVGTQQFKEYGLDYNYKQKLMDGIEERILDINGKKVKFLTFPKDDSAVANKVEYPDRGVVERCHWLFEDNGLYKCRIHPIRSITCGMPHVRFIHNSTTNRTNLTVGPYGRNWALGCPVKFPEVLHEPSVQSRIHWLTMLKGAADDMNIETYLPEILRYLKAGNRSSAKFANNGNRSNSLITRAKLIPVSVDDTPEGVEPEGFNIYFAGSQNKLAEQYLKQHGANRLASQLLDRDVIEGWIESSKQNHAKGRLFIDSGAFSAHTRGAEVDVDEYIEYLNSIDEYLHVFAQVDKIPGVFREPKTPSQLLEAPALSWQNYLYMRPKLKSPKKLLPIFHQGEDYKWLHNMLEWVDENGEHIPYIGISPANDQPVGSKIQYIEKCFKIIKHSSNPTVQTHAFGMTSLYVLEMYPFTSADSTTWIINGANGSIMSKYGSVTLSSARLDSPDHIRKMPKAAYMEIQSHVEALGYTMEGLATDYKQRIIFNIQFLLEWSKNYKYRPSDVRRRPLF